MEAKKTTVVTFKTTEEVKHWLESQAKVGYRSLSAQIAMLVEQSKIAQENASVKKAK